MQGDRTQPFEFSNIIRTSLTTAFIPRLFAATSTKSNASSQNNQQQPHNLVVRREGDISKSVKNFGHPYFISVMGDCQLRPPAQTRSRLHVYCWITALMQMIFLSAEIIPIATRRCAV